MATRKLQTIRISNFFNDEVIKDKIYSFLNETLASEETLKVIADNEEFFKKIKSEKILEDLIKHLGSSRRISANKISSIIAGKNYLENFSDENFCEVVKKLSSVENAAVIEPINKLAEIFNSIKSEGVRKSAIEVFAESKKPELLNAIADAKTLFIGIEENSIKKYYELLVDLNSKKIESLDKLFSDEKFNSDVNINNHKIGLVKNARNAVGADTQTIILEVLNVQLSRENEHGLA